LVQQGKEEVSAGGAGVGSPKCLTLDYGPAFRLRHTMGKEAIWT
jgi:hypothetical protein